MAEQVGIIGSRGDLGSQIWESVLGHKLRRPLPYDVQDTVGGSVDVHARSDILHWCAPLDALFEEPTFYWNPESDLILHNSVMDGSFRAGAELTTQIERTGRKAPQISVVHMLMNEHNTVVTAEGFTTARVKQHLADIGLHQIEMPAEEHDRLMARSQAPMAILCEVILPELRNIPPELLTPSGVALLTALEDRSAQWTEKTLETLGTNPHLPYLMRQLTDHVHVRNGHDTTQ